MKPIICTCILILLWFFWILLLYPRPKHRVEMLKTDDLKTGDLLFMSGDTYAEKMFKCFSECPYSHVAIVINNNNEIHLFEADVGQGFRDGIRVIPLLTKIDRWRGRKEVAVRRYFGDLQIENEISKRILTDRRDMDSLFLSCVFGIRSDKNIVFCSEMVAEIFGIQKPVTIDPGNLYRTIETPHHLPQEFLIF